MPAVNDLPNEILIQIFLHHNTLYCKSQSIPQRAYACDGAKLMLVCRHWRELAVSTPCLWQATKVRRKPKWFNLVLSRSRNLPLDVVFQQPTSMFDILSCIVLLIPHIHRLHSMLIPAINGMRQVLEVLFRLSMPLLSDLEVHAKSGGGPLDLSSERLPVLRSLRLSSCAIPWIPSILLNLRRLDLQECTCEDGSVTMKQLLGVFSECVELRELRLHNFLSTLRGASESTTAEGDRGPSTSISIPHLRNLSVHDKPHLLSRFLSYLRLSADTDVHIVGHILDATVDTTNAFLSMLPKDTSGLPLLHTVKSAEIECCDIGCELVGYTRWPYVGPRITLELELGVFTKWSFYLESMLRELSLIFSRAPLDNLRIVGRFNRVRQLNAWVKLFTTFPTIRYLELAGKHSPLSVIAALAQPSYDESGLDANGAPATEAGVMDDSCVKGSLVLPHLRALDVEYLDWCPGLVEMMVMVLERRIANGLPKLEDLRLYLNESTSDEGGRLRTMKVYRRVLISLVENLEDSFRE